MGVDRLLANHTANVSLLETFVRLFGRCVMNACEILLKHFCVKTGGHPGRPSGGTVGPFEHVWARPLLRGT